MLRKDSHAVPGRGVLLAGLLVAAQATAQGAPANALAAYDDQVEADFARACTMPLPPASLPDGTQAGRDDMVDAMRAVKQLDTDTTAYGQCLQQRATALLADAALTPAQRAAVQRSAGALANDAVDRTERIARLFNEELRKFKERPAESTGKRFAPARMQGQLDLEGCVTPQIAGLSGNFRMRLGIDAAGKATVEELRPLAAAPALFGLAACASGKLAFTPATRDGQAVASEVWIPFRLAAYAGEPDPGLRQPQLASTAAQFVAATDECYPAEARAAGAEGDVRLKLVLSDAGSVRTPTVDASSGNALVDETARCIARRLRFTPVAVDDIPQEAEITWTVPVKPPAKWLEPKP